MRPSWNRLFAWCMLSLTACGTPYTHHGLPPLPDDQEAVSLLGQPLMRPEVAAAARGELEANLEQAVQDLLADPDDPELLIWLGRRQAYLGRYRAAVETYSEGLLQHPDDPRILRHRGHRFLTLRLPKRAVRDLTRAAELVEGRSDAIEADGMPNAAGQPRSTLHFNIYYHLGLAHFVSGDRPAAVDAWRKCLAVSTNDDSVCATANWLNLTLRLLGRDEEAAAVRERITADMDLLENTAYHRILLLHKGELDMEQAMGQPQNAVEKATLGFGVAGWLLCEGREDEAEVLLQSILELPSWSAFGYLAAEAEWWMRTVGPPGLSNTTDS